MSERRGGQHGEQDIFFSSRRRHTRWNCDWSSDVCSSDLLDPRQRFIQRGDHVQPMRTVAHLLYGRLPPFFFFCTQQDITSLLFADSHYTIGCSSSRMIQGGREMSGRSCRSSLARMMSSPWMTTPPRSEEHTSELQSHFHLLFHP